MGEVKAAAVGGNASENTPSIIFRENVQGPDAPLHIRNNESTSYTPQLDRERLPANPNMCIQESKMKLRTSYYS